MAVRTSGSFVFCDYLHLVDVWSSLRVKIPPQQTLCASIFLTFYNSMEQFTDVSSGRSIFFPKSQRFRNFTGVATLQVPMAISVSQLEKSSNVTDSLFISNAKSLMVCSKGQQLRIEVVAKGLQRCYHSCQILYFISKYSQIFHITVANFGKVFYFTNNSLNNQI